MLVLEVLAGNVESWRDLNRSSDASNARHATEALEKRRAGSGAHATSNHSLNFAGMFGWIVWGRGWSPLEIFWNSSMRFLPSKGRAPTRHS